MALPMLVNGADCGPSNPLQGLSKRFDHDRGLQQDHFGAGRAGSSTEAFRSQHAGPSTPDQGAAQFFSANSLPASNFSTASPFDLSVLHGALPMSQMQVPFQSPQSQQQHSLAAWASDFAHQQPMQPLTPVSTEANPGALIHHDVSTKVPHHMPTRVPQGGMQWNSSFVGYRPVAMPNFAAQIPTQVQQSVIHDQSMWDIEFNTQELSLAPSPPPLQEIQQNQQIRQQTPHEADELARTAGLLLENVKYEQNPKFQNSQFMGLMKQLRDGMMVVEGNQIVENSANSWASDFTTDVKGKGKAIDTHHGAQLDAPTLTTNSPLGRSIGPTFGTHMGASLVGDAVREFPVSAQELPQESANDAYFRQENADYSSYWNDPATAPTQRVSDSVTPSWDQLQADWDQFEATTTGIKAIDNYQFQDNNPYLLGNSSKTRHHLTHLGLRQAFLESVLELEAAVQRDRNDANAWFELGVKQQENEREQKALQALQRAVSLDPSHLPTWLALAISHTNDNNRLGTYNSILEWVDRNDNYRNAVQQYRSQTAEKPDASITEKFTQLINCLIAMARSNLSGEVDADIQIALAVLLNTNEDYEKAQDCFRTALAVRPEDWLLYNRVGATMANSGHAGEALEYYYRALELNPGYIRARFNLGISCINLRRYEEAAQHILDALVLQDGDSVHDSAGLNEKRGVTSTALWESLKTTCLHMQRVDLATLCDRQDLEGFRAKFSM